jgi:hypothetical protein
MTHYENKHEHNDSLTQQVTHLLKSCDEKKLFLALELIKKAKANKILVSYLTAIHLYHQDEEVREKFGVLYKKYASERLQLYILKNWEAKDRQNPYGIDLKRFCQSDLDLCAFVLAYKVTCILKGDKEYAYSVIILDHIPEKWLTDMIMEWDFFIQRLYIRSKTYAYTAALHKRLLQLPLMELQLEMPVSVFPVEVLSIPSLRFLTIEYFISKDAQLLQIPEIPVGRYGLTDLTISSMAIDAPEKLSVLKSLQFLKLSHCHVKDMSFVGALKVLRHVILSDNEITKIPPVVGELKELETLILNENNLGAIDFDFTALSKLKILKLASSGVTYLPDHFYEMMLTDVELQNNMLETLPLSIFASTRPDVYKREVYAEKNKIRCLVIENNSAPETLYYPYFGVVILSDNELTEVPDVFVHSKKIRHLDLRGNNFSSIQDSLLQIKADELLYSLIGVPKKGVELPLSVFNSEASSVTIHIASKYKLVLPPKEEIPLHSSTITIEHPYAVLYNEAIKKKKRSY